MLSSKKVSFAEQVNYQISPELKTDIENLKTILALLLNLNEEMVALELPEDKKTQFSKSWLKSLQKIQLQLDDFEADIVDKSKRQINEENNAKWASLCEWVKGFVQSSIKEMITDTFDFIKTFEFEFEEANCFEELKSINANLLKNIILPESEQQVLIRIYKQLAKDFKNLNKNVIPLVSPYILSEQLKSQIKGFKLFLEKSLDFRVHMESRQKSSSSIGLYYQEVKACWPRQDFLESAQKTLMTFEDWFQAFSSYSVCAANNRKWESKCKQLSDFIRATIKDMRDEILSFLNKVSNVSPSAELDEAVLFFKQWNLNEEVFQISETKLPMCFPNIKLALSNLINNLDSKKTTLFAGQEQLHYRLLKYIIEHTKKMVLRMEEEPLKETYSTFFYKTSIGLACKEKLPKIDYLDFCIKELEQVKEDNLLLTMDRIFNALSSMLTGFEVSMKDHYRKNVEKMHKFLLSGMSASEKNGLILVYWMQSMNDIFFADVIDETKLKEIFIKVDLLFSKLQKELERLAIMCIHIERESGLESTGESSLKAEEFSFSQKDIQVVPLSPEGDKYKESIRKTRTFFEETLRKTNMLKSEHEHVESTEQKLPVESTGQKLPDNVNPNIQTSSQLLNNPAVLFSPVKSVPMVKADSLATAINTIKSLISLVDDFDGKKEVMKQLNELHKASISLKTKKSATEEVQTTLNKLLDLLKTFETSLGDKDKKMIRDVLKTNLGVVQTETLKLGENKLIL